MSKLITPISEQVMVITGASSGIGLATAYAAAEQGARLVLVARSEDILMNVVDLIVENGGEAMYVVADVSQREELERVAQIAIERFGSIDTWVNNAGVSIYGRLDEVSDEDHRRLFDINFWGVVYGSLVALPHLIKSEGTLINLGSEVSEAVLPLQGMYSATKHAVKGFTDALRVEVQELDQAPISITLIQPTAVNTPYPQHAKNYMNKEPKLPTPQIDPADVANAILEAATSITHHIKVGMMSKVNTTLQNLMPTLAEKMSAKQANRQQYAEAPRDPDGTLYAPSGDGHVHGSGGIVTH
ncbi:SDR family oxidoreductase [Methylophilus sp.]|uniref:SDR family oxidoreductase n=1 Tax=Methylophilus sp. TaxID=29541 RepID=UPI000D3F8734|nr:SDR family oxidoreductase [Methylophilus sp.]PPD12604.1 MAG: short-chain dehydrogenase [Methylophilus sp.]